MASRSANRTHPEELHIIPFDNPFNTFKSLNQIPFTKLKEIKQVFPQNFNLLYMESIWLPFSEPFPAPLYLSYAAVPRTAQYS